MRAIVEIAGHGQHEFEFPLHAGEMTFSTFIDFKKALEAGGLVGSKKDEEDESGQDNGESTPVDDPKLMDPEAYFETIVLALSKVVTGPIHLLDLYSDDDDIRDLMMTGARFQPGDRFNVIRIYGHLLAMLNGYRTDRLDFSGDFAVDYKGVRYVINQDRSRRFFTRQAYSVVEVIEIQETNRLFKGAIEKRGDPDGVLEFEMDLRTVAVLLREPGHLLPINKAERHAYIEKMARHFQELPMDVVLEIRFFLRSTLGELARILTMHSFLLGSEIWSLIHPRRGSSVIRKSKGRGSKRLRRLTDLLVRSGWFSLRSSMGGSPKPERTHTSR